MSRYPQVGKLLLLNNKCLTIILLNNIKGSQLDYKKINFEKESKFFKVQSFMFLTF
jgi:hypothetical protein